MDYKESIHRKDVIVYKKFSSKILYTNHSFLMKNPKHSFIISITSNPITLTFLIIYNTFS
jgi:hypothetical protein